MSDPSSTRVITGHVHVHARGFGFVTATDAQSGEVQSAFVPPPILNRFFAGDLVEATVEPSGEGRLTVRDAVLKARSRRTVFGEYLVRRGVPHLHVDRTVSNTDLPIDPAGLEIAPGQCVIARIEDAGLRALATVQPNEQALARVIARHDLSSEFAPEVMGDVARARAVPHALGARRDLREVPTVTIDAPTTRDIDDAISVLPAEPDGAMRVLVSIADASEFVGDGTPLDRAARDRATSVYFAGRVLPMLPDELSADWISLLPGQDRLCITCEMRIDPEGEIRAVDVYESVIRSFARLDYTETAAFLDHGTVSERIAKVHEAMRWFRTASARLSVARGRRGGMVIDRDDVRITLDPATGHVRELSREGNTSGHVMIERLMVAANEAIARWLQARGVTVPFRVHDEPDRQRVQDVQAIASHFGFETGFGASLTPLALAAFDAQIAGAACEPALRSVLRRALGPARYTAAPQPHFGLGAPLYLHFTSPIRRYADLAVHRTLKRYLHGRRDTEPTPEVERLCEHINMRAAAASKAEAERQHMLHAEWVAARLQTVFDAHVTQIRPFGLIVQIDGTPVSGAVAYEALAGGPYVPDARELSVRGPGGAYTIGTAMRVRAVSADAALGRVEFVPEA